MSFDMHQTFQDLMKADVMSGYHIVTAEREARTHIQVDYFCIADLERPYEGPEQGIRPLEDFTRYNVIELEGLGRTLDESRFRYHLGRTLVMENPVGKPNRLGEKSLTILTVHKPQKLLTSDRYAFEKLSEWKYRVVLLNDLSVTIIVLRELQKIRAGEAAAWLQVLEPDPKVRRTVWSQIPGQELTSRERLKSIMMKIDEEAFMTVADEFRTEGREEGRKEGKVEVVQNMVRKGLETKLILEVTGFSGDQIDKIIVEMDDNE